MARASSPPLSSALALRGEETGGFTTVDLLQLDLFTGEGELFKLDLHCIRFFRVCQAFPRSAGSFWVRRSTRMTRAVRSSVASFRSRVTSSRARSLKKASPKENNKPAVEKTAVFHSPKGRVIYV